MESIHRGPVPGTRISRLNTNPRSISAKPFDPDPRPLGQTSDSHRWRLIDGPSCRDSTRTKIAGICGCQDATGRIYIEECPVVPRTNGPRKRIIVRIYGGERADDRSGVNINLPR